MFGVSEADFDMAGGGLNEIDGSHAMIIIS